MEWWSVSVAHRQPPAVRVSRLSLQSGVDARLPLLPSTDRHAERDVARVPRWYRSGLEPLEAEDFQQLAVTHIHSWNTTLL